MRDAPYWTPPVRNGELHTTVGEARPIYRGSIGPVDAARIIDQHALAGVSNRFSGTSFHSPQASGSLVQPVSPCAWNTER